MKKLLIVCFIVLTSSMYFGCSDKNSDPSPSSVQIKKLISQEENDNGELTTFTSLFKYNSDKKLVKIEDFEGTSTEPSEYIEFIYNVDGRITQYNSYEGNVMTYKAIYTYSSNQVTSIGSYYDGDWVEDEKIVLDLNTDGLVEKVSYSYKDIDTWYDDAYYTYEWANNNLVKEEHFYNDGGNKLQKSSKVNKILSHLKRERSSHNSFKASLSSQCHTTTYQFNSKNNPFWNISFFSVMSPVDTYLPYSKNAIQSTTRTWVGETGSEVTTFAYEFNNNDYPTKITENYVYDDGAGYTDEGSYELQIEYY